SIVSARRLDRIVQFDVCDFGATDDLLLDFGRNPVPRVEIVEILLHDDIAAARESRVFFANEYGILGHSAGGIFCAVDKAEQIALVEVAKALDLVSHGDYAFKASHDLHGKFEAEVHALGAYVEDHVARRRDGVAPPGTNFTEGMQFRWPW